MKIRLLILFLLAWFTTSAQPPTSKYTPIQTRTNQIDEYFRNISLPVRGSNDTTVTSGQWPWAGITVIDTVNHKLYFKSGDGHWHQASGGSSGSLQTIVATGNSTPSTIVTGQKDSIGYIYKYLMGTNPIDPTIGKTGSATLAVDGSKMLIVGGTRTLNNYLDFPLKFGWWNFTIKFKTVVHHKSGTSGGLGVAIVAAGAGTSVMWSFMQHDTAAYVNYSPAVQLPQLTDENNKGLVDWRWNNYDTVEHIIQRRGRSFTAEMRDVGTGITSRFHEDDRMFNAVGNLRLYLYNDSTWFVDSLTIKADEPKNPVAFYIGDSWVYGGDASTEANSHVVKSSSGYTAIYSGGPSEQSLQGTYRFGDLVAAAPQIAFWEDNVNDINSSGGGPGVALDSFCKRTIRFIQLCNSIGTVPILATPGPQVADGTKWKDSINVIGARFNVRVMPVFETLKDTLQTYLAAKYVGNSSIHMNDPGHDKYAELERFEIQRLGFSKAPTIQWPSIPRSSYFKYELGLNEANQPVAMPARTNPNYLWAISGTINNLTVPQVGSGSYIGNWWWVCNPEFIITPLGTSPASAPYFKVDAVNGVSARVLTAGLGGLVVNTTSTTFNTNAVDIASYIRTSSIPLLVKTTLLGSSKNILSLNSNPSTWNITDTLFAVHRADSLKAFVDPFGGIQLNWLSGYRQRFDYSLLHNEDFVTKRWLDSIAAAIVAGVGGITGFTDGAGFDGTVTGSNLSLKTQYTGGKLMFADNTAGMIATDSLKWVNGQLYINQYHTTLPQVRVGDVGITAFSLNNYWIGPIKYNSGFKYITSGSYAPHIYFNAGSIDLNVTTTTGSADAAATVLTAVHIDKGGNTGILLSTPREALDINGAISVRTVNLGTSVDSMFTDENGRLTAISATNWGRTASTGITNAAGTWTSNLSTGVGGGQSIIFGTAANDQGIIRGSTVASGSTTTNPDVTFITGDGAGTTAFQLLKNTTALFSGSVGFPIRTVSGTATAAVTDHTILVDATAGAITINLPAASGAAKIEYIIKKIDNSVNAVTLDGSGSETIDGSTTKALNTQYAGVRIQCDGTSWYIIGTF